MKKQLVGWISHRAIWRDDYDGLHWAYYCGQCHDVIGIFRKSFQLKDPKFWGLLIRKLEIGHPHCEIHKPHRIVINIDCPEEKIRVIRVC